MKYKVITAIRDPRPAGTVGSPIGASPRYRCTVRGLATTRGAIRPESTFWTQGAAVHREGQESEREGRETPPSRRQQLCRTLTVRASSPRCPFVRGWLSRIYNLYVHRYVAWLGNRRIVRPEGMRMKSPFLAGLAETTVCQKAPSMGAGKGSEAVSLVAAWYYWALVPSRYSGPQKETRGGHLG